MATEAAWLECKGIHRKEKENRKRKTPLQERRRKTFLTLTGLLMEGLIPPSTPYSVPLVAMNAFLGKHLLELAVG
jgi:hypothetical protein